MDNFQKIKSPIQDILSSQFFLTEKIISPKRDWYALIILLIIFIISSLGFDLYMYQQISDGDMYTSVSRKELVIENLKSSELKKILDNFQIKESKITILKMENIVDPSI